LIFGARFRIILKETHTGVKKKCTDQLRKKTNNVAKIAIGIGFGFNDDSDHGLAGGCRMTEDLGLHSTPREFLDKLPRKTEADHARDRELLLEQSSGQFSEEEQRTREALRLQALQDSRKRLAEWLQSG